MIKFYFILLILTSTLTFPQLTFAQTEQLASGTISITAIRERGKKYFEKVKFTISDDFARIDATNNIHYLVNLKTEKVYIVNHNRKSVTIMFASNLLDQSLPPLIILRDRAGLKKYLSSVNAHLDKITTESSTKYELWKFNISNFYYTVLIKLPEYFPKQVEVSSKNNKTIATVITKREIDSNTVAPNFFTVPLEYNLVDLISK